MAKGGATCWTMAITATFGNPRRRLPGEQRRRPAPGRGSNRRVASSAKLRGREWMTRTKTIPKQSQCGHCHGFVHGSNEPGCPNCWNYHLHNSVAGRPGDTFGRRPSKTSRLKLATFPGRAAPGTPQNEIATWHIAAQDQSLWDAMIEQPTCDPYISRGPGLHAIS